MEAKRSWAQPPVSDEPFSAACPILHKISEMCDIQVAYHKQTNWMFVYVFIEAKRGVFRFSDLKYLLVTYPTYLYLLVLDIKLIVVKRGHQLTGG